MTTNRRPLRPGRARPPPRSARRSPTRPTIAVVLGSGLGALADRLADPVVDPLRDDPPLPRADGRRPRGQPRRRHARRGPGRWLLQGRFHYYEGHDLDAVTFPVRVLQRLGRRDPDPDRRDRRDQRRDFRPGDLVCLSDHLNLIGANPLRGPNDDRLGPAVPRHDRGLLAPAPGDRRARRPTRLGHRPRTTGVYACLPGPSYETPAEIRMLRTLGADVVGMSTVPEAIVARHAGMEVLAFALVTNAAAGVIGAPITHEEVLEAGREARRRGSAALIEAVVGAARRGRSSRSSAPIGPVEQVDRVGDLDRAAPLLDLAGDLEDAADVAGGDDVGPGRLDVVHLAAAEPLGHLGLGQVVGPRGAAADLALFERDELQAGDHPEQLPGLGADLLAVAEVAGVVIGDLHRQRVRRRDRAELDEELGDVPDLGDEPLGGRRGRRRAGGGRSP